VTDRASAEAECDSETDPVVSAILAASWVLVGISARSVAAVDEPVTLRQFRTLAVLGRYGPINLQRLANELQVNASTALRTVDRLVANGLVNRAENPASRREVILTLTDSGQRLADAVMAQRRAEIGRIVQGLPIARRTALVDGLKAFTDAAGGAGPGSSTGTLEW
jgi:DNA-binding MarR family transcriptional regulator